MTHRRRNSVTRLAWMAASVMAVLTTAHAEVSLPPLFADHMVLQRGRKLPVWGQADAGEKVTVSLAGQTKVATADADGAWRVDLDQVTSTDALTLTVSGKNQVEITDVLMGEVWLCSGQSNMNWRVQSSLNFAEEKAAANYPRIRHFQIGSKVSQTPLKTFTGRWAVCAPGTVGAFTAVGYFFGRTLHEATDVPIGLIHSSWGGTPAEAWTSRPVLGSIEECRPILERFEQALERYPEAKEAYDKRMEDWKQKVKDAKAAGEKPPRRPRPPMGETHQHSPAGLYNGMINPLIPFAIRGAIWYQGESNAGRAYQYRKLLPGMVNCWRTAWGQDDFPFGIVQLANFRAQQTDPNEASSWAELREAQLMTAQNTPNTGLAVIIDVGEDKNIHPKNKQDVGKRLGAWALATVYGRKRVYSGPVFESMSVEGSKARLKFTHAGGGLTGRDGELKGFAVAGEDKTFHWAEASIDGNSVVVSSPDVQKPVAVRYGWANNPTCTLYNKEGFPATPFRTDDWTGATEGKN